jgi:hypothetical protein
VATSIHLPVSLEAIVACPKCDDLVDVTIELRGRLVADDDGTGEIKCRLVQKAVPHVCAQTRLDELVRIPDIESISIEHDGRKVTLDEEGLGRLRSLSRGDIE